MYDLGVLAREAICPGMAVSPDETQTLASSGIGGSTLV